MREIVKVLPSEELVFLNDNLNLAAGFKTDEEVVADSIAVSKFLAQFDPKAVVIACNTATAVALESLRSEYRFPVVGVIEPAARAAVAATKSGKIGVIGTYMTIRSNAYPNLIRKLKPDAEVTSKATPLLVPMIEEDQTTDVLREVARGYLREFEGKGIDTMILGCTHYSLINHLFSDLLPGVKLVDPALHTATELKSILTSRNLLSNNSTAAKYSFYATNLKQQSDSVTRRVFAEHPLKQRVEWQHASL